MAQFTFQRRFYNRFVLPLVYVALSAAAPFHRKLKETFASRRNFRGRWQKARGRFSERPVWFHVSSVGEYEQAKPVISKLRETHPHLPVAVSFTSPSGYKYASKHETLGNGNNIRFMEYLPLDFADNARFCIDALNPRLLVFVKFDLWPNLIWEASAAGIPTVLIDATLSEGSQRLSPLGRRFYRAVYSDLEKILAISEGDAGRFMACAPGHTGITVAGDTRFDRVMERKRHGNGTKVTIDTRNRFVVICGSIWGRDEEHLLPALVRLSRDARDLLLVMAPHEPTERHVTALLEWARANGIDAATLSNPAATARVLVVDSVGKLAELYRFADVAYVGGSFSTGVHSVIEPAIMGIPVIFGPVHKNSFEAIELHRSGAAFAVDDEQAIYDRLVTMYRDVDMRAAMGARARSYVESHLGATDRCVETMSCYL
jgi:3-deoxy-D-manno-octulosonic-acid transferase